MSSIQAAGVAPTPVTYYPAEMVKSPEAFEKVAKLTRSAIAVFQLTVRYVGENGQALSGCLPALRQLSSHCEAYCALFAVTQIGRRFIERFNKDSKGDYPCLAWNEAKRKARNFLVGAHVAELLLSIQNYGFSIGSLALLPLKPIKDVCIIAASYHAIQSLDKEMGNKRARKTVREEKIDKWASRNVAGRLREKYLRENDDYHTTKLRLANALTSAFSERIYGYMERVVKENDLTEQKKALKEAKEWLVATYQLVPARVQDANGVYKTVISTGKAVTKESKEACRWFERFSWYEQQLLGGKSLDEAYAAKAEAKLQVWKQRLANDVPELAILETSAKWSFAFDVAKIAMCTVALLSLTVSLVLSAPIVATYLGVVGLSATMLSSSATSFFATVSLVAGFATAFIGVAKAYVDLRKNYHVQKLEVDTFVTHYEAPQPA